MKGYKEIFLQNEVKNLRTACHIMLEVIKDLHKMGGSDEHQKLCEMCMNNYDGVANQAKKEELAFRKINKALEKIQQ